MMDFDDFAGVPVIYTGSDHAMTSEKSLEKFAAIMLVAMKELAKKRMKCGLLVIGLNQVTALPEGDYDQRQTVTITLAHTTSYGAPAPLHKETPQ